MCIVPSCSVQPLSPTSTHLNYYKTVEKAGELFDQYQTENSNNTITKQTNQNLNGIRRGNSIFLMVPLIDADYVL